MTGGLAARSLTLTLMLTQTRTQTRTNCSRRYVFDDGGPATDLWLMVMIPLAAWVTVAYLVFFHDRVTLFNYSQVPPLGGGGSLAHGAPSPLHQRVAGTGKRPNVVFWRAAAALPQTLGPFFSFRFLAPDAHVVRRARLRATPLAGPRQLRPLLPGPRARHARARHLLPWLPPHRLPPRSVTTPLAPAFLSTVFFAFFVFCFLFAFRRAAKLSSSLAASLPLFLRCFLPLGCCGPTDACGTPCRGCCGRSFASPAADCPGCHGPFARCCRGRSGTADDPGAGPRLGPPPVGCCGDTASAGMPVGCCGPCKVPPPPPRAPETAAK